jgi:hypothetical protein
MTLARAEIERIIGGVIRQSIEDAGALGLLVLEPDSPEGRLVVEIAASAIGRDRVGGTERAVEGDPVMAAEAERMRARVAARKETLVVAHPANKTSLLLSRDVPPESLLPLGDLYASQIEAMLGSATLPEDVAALAQAVGGVSVLDAALRGWLEERRPLVAALELLAPAGRPAVVERLRANRAVRRWPRRVPKLGARTLWIDVFA